MEQQQQQQLNSGVLKGIARLTDPRYREERHKLVISGWTSVPVDRRSWDHLVNVLDSHEVVITEIWFLQVELLNNPPDGGLDVLRSFFARSSTTLTKVQLWYCNFGSAQDASRLIGVFQSSRTVTDLEIPEIRYQRGAPLGACLSSLLQNMPQLQRLDCSRCALRVKGIRALQPALRTNRTLRELNMDGCGLGDGGIRILADALVGNSTMYVLNISHNYISSNGLADITRVLESTRLKKISLVMNGVFFGNEASTKRFARVISRHPFLKELCLYGCQLGVQGIRFIADGLVGNTTMKVLDIGYNGNTSAGLPNITRMTESTRLHTIDIEDNEDVFNDEDATEHFVTTLQNKKSSLQDLVGIHEDHFPAGISAAIYTRIDNSLTRNEQLNRVDSLLTPPPPPPSQQQQRNDAGTMMLKTWHKAITKFAMVPNNGGASAIFKLFQARPQVLEKRIKRPVDDDATTGSSRQQDSSSHDDDGNDSRGGTITTTATTATANGGQKRQRL